MENRGINLGRCHNKYLIIEMFCFAGEKKVQEEAEITLWISSRRHRSFLPKNFSWYRRNLMNKTWLSLLEQSSQIESYLQAKLLFDNIRIDYERKEVTKVTLLYRASQDGWKSEDFQLHCHKRETNSLLFLFRSSLNYLAAGFSDRPVYYCNAHKEIIQRNPYLKVSRKPRRDCMTIHCLYCNPLYAMLFQLTNGLEVFKTRNPSDPVGHYDYDMRAPLFYGALCLDGSPLNAKNIGRCETKGKNDYGKFDVPEDEEGRNVLTGSKFFNEHGSRCFTCVELEVFALQ